MLPIKILTIEQAKEQWEEIKDFTYDAYAILAGVQARPGQNPKNVFDFDDNLRLIISREKALTGDLIIHMSASQHNATKIDFRPLAEKRYIEIVNISPLEYVGVSPVSNIPHWVHIFHN